MRNRNMKTVVTDEWFVPFTVNDPGFLSRHLLQKGTYTQVFNFPEIIAKTV